jgi:steroid delta-isomerase
MSSAALETTITQYYISLAAMNQQQWLELMAENAVIYDPVGKPPLKVKEDSQKFFDLLSKFYQTFEIAQDSVFVVQQEAAVKWTMKVVAKNGRSTNAEGISIFHFNELGKISQILSYWNESLMKSQLMG